MEEVVWRSNLTCKCNARLVGGVFYGFLRHFVQFQTRRKSGLFEMEMGSIWNLLSKAML